jgi:hypothetical protein
MMPDARGSGKKKSQFEYRREQLRLQISSAVQGCGASCTFTRNYELIKWSASKLLRLDSAASAQDISLFARVVDHIGQRVT